MKNPCKNCGKYTSELDDFGYCKKCSTKLFKQSRHTTIEQIKIEKNMKITITLIILLFCIGFSFYFRNNIFGFISSCFERSSSNNNPINNVVQFIVPLEDKTLTSENYETLSEEFSSQNKDSDKLYYYSYACMYYIIKDGFSYAVDLSLTESQQKEIMYSKIYGKTINQLISEGKKLMQDNNISIDEYKKSLNSLNNTTNEE